MQKWQHTSSSCNISNDSRLVNVDVACSKHRVHNALENQGESSKSMNSESEQAVKKYSL